MKLDSRLTPYAVAIVCPSVSAAVGTWLHAALAYRFPLISFYPAIMVTAWFGGLWPGLVATGLAVAFVQYLWLAPIRSVQAQTPGDLVALVLFGCIGLVMSVLSESMHRAVRREHAARVRVEASEQALSDSERQLRQALLREQTARTEAELANQSKDRFLAMLSHELRTPLNALLGWADMLRGHVLSDAQRARAVQSIYTNALKQTQLVNDLLDISGTMTGKLQLRRTRVSMEEIVRAALEIVKGAAEAKCIALTFDCQTTNSTLNADPVRLEQVCCNLLINAIKFTPERGTVRVHLRQDDQFVEFVVSDTGQGIPAEHLHAIFEPFHQVDASTTRAHDGLGLGLTIVKYLVEAHGGEVTASSGGRGHGATFLLKLPIEPATGSPAPAQMSSIMK